MKKWLILPLLLSLSLTACTSGMELKKHTFTFELGADVFANPSLYVKNPDKYDLRNAKVISNSKGLSKVENHFVNEQKDYLACGVYEFTYVIIQPKSKWKKGKCQTSRMPFKLPIYLVRIMMQLGIRQLQVPAM